MPDFAYAPAPPRGIERSLGPRPSGRVLDDQGASYSAAFLMRFAVDCFIDLLTFAPSTVSRVLPNVRLSARPSEGGAVLYGTAISQLKLRELESEYWASYAALASRVSEAGSAAASALVGRVVRHTEAGR